MFGWLFKKREDGVNIHFENSVKKSFSNIKDDMSQISQWIGHFKQKHDIHEQQFSDIVARLNAIENQLGSLQISLEDQEFESEKNDDEGVDSYEKEFEKWDELTPVQKSLCWKIYRLQKEKPLRWLSLKEIAAELYPEREYSKVRSTVSDYVGLLEEFDYLERKRKGRQAYVRFKKKNLPSEKESTEESVEKTKDKKKSSD